MDRVTHVETPGMSPRLASSASRHRASSAMGPTASPLRFFRLICNNKGGGPISLLFSNRSFERLKWISCASAE